MHINFNEHMFEVKEQEFGGETWYTLKDVERGWRTVKSDFESPTSLRRWIFSHACRRLLNSCAIQLLYMKGYDTNFIYGDKEALIEFACYCSISFRKALLRTLIAASEGDGNSAVNITTTVMRKLETTQN